MSKLGTVADFTDLLDTLVKLDSGERESNERMAMAHLREDREDRRQDKRIEAQKDFSIDLENRKTLMSYDEGDLVKDEVGLLRPSDGAITRAEKSKLETGLQTIVGAPVDYDTPAYSSLMGAINKGSTWYEQVNYTGDKSPGVLSYHDIPEILNRLEVPEGVDPAQYEAAFRSGVRANKGIIQSDKELQDYKLGKARTRVYDQTQDYTMTEEEREKFAFQQDDIKRDFWEPIYKKVFNPTDLGLEVGSTFDSMMSAIKEQVIRKKDSSGNYIMSDEQIRDADVAINDLFGLTWSGRGTSREFLNTFKRWDKEARGGARSMAEIIFNQFGLQDSYDDLHKLTSDYIDVRGLLKEKDIKRHFQSSIQQNVPLDDFEAQFGHHAMQFFDALQQNNIIDYGYKNNKLLFKIKDRKQFQEGWNQMMNDPRDSFRLPALKMQRLFNANEIIIEDF